MVGSWYHLHTPTWLKYIFTAAGLKYVLKDYYLSIITMISTFRYLVRRKSLKIYHFIFSKFKEI